MSAGSIVIDLLMKTGSFETDTKRAEKSLQKMKAEAEKVGKAIGAAMAAAATATAYFVKQQINAADELGKSAARVGVSTQALSGLQYAAEMSGVSMDALKSNVGRLNRALADGNKAFDAMGLSVKNADGSLKSADKMLLEVADKFKGYQDGAAKSALAMEIFGKSGAEMITLLNEGSAGIKTLTDEAEQFGLVLDEKTTKAAAEFNDNLARITAAQAGMVRQLTAELLPAMNVLSAEMVNIAKNSDLVRLVANGLTVVFQTLAVIGSDIVFVFRMIGQEIGGIAAQIAALLRLDFKGFKFIGEAMKEDAAKARAELDAFQARVMGIGGATPSAGGSAMPSPMGAAAPIVAGGKGNAKVKDEYAEWMAEIEKGAAGRRGYIHGQMLDDMAKREADYNDWMQQMREGELTRYVQMQEKREESEVGYWERWLEAASEALTSFNDLASGVAQTFSNSFGTAFEQMVFDSKNLRDAISGMAESMARSIVNALGQMAGQWLAYKAVQTMVGKTGAASAASAQTFEALAAQQMAALNAFAATAAIPFVGPAMAPAAAGAALAATSPFVATVASLGAAAVGARATGGPVSADAPYLVGERGPELFVPHTAGAIVPNNKMGAGGGVTVNLIEDKSRAGKTEERTNNGARELDVFVADIMGDGPRGKAIQKAFGLQRRGY